MTTRTATRDLERSTYQGRPCYRYIRESDRLPSIEESRDMRDPVARVKLFDPTSGWTWWIAAYDPVDRLAYGLTHGFEDELGYISMEEITVFRGRFGLPIERDLHWTPRPLSECAGS